MIQKLKESLKNAPIHNYFCIIDASIDDFENKDNAFIYGDNELVMKKKENLRTKHKTRLNPSNIESFIDENWLGCVCYTPNKFSKTTIYTIGFPEKKEKVTEEYMGSVIDILAKWMERNKEDVCITESLFDSLGHKHSKTIRKIVMDTFENSKQTLYIARKNKK